MGISVSENKYKDKGSPNYENVQGGLKCKTCKKTIKMLEIFADTLSKFMLTWVHINMYIVLKNLTVILAKETYHSKA